MRHLVSVTTLFAVPSVNATIVVTSFDPTIFQPDIAAMDAALGLAGFTVEDFEDVNLSPGLSISLQNRDVGPFTTLPGVFNPATDPDAGLANSAWDGDSVLLNHVANDWPQVFGSDKASQEVVFHLTGGIKQVGLGLSHFQTVNGAHTLLVNGSSVGDISVLSGYSDGLDRNLYVRVAATGADQITTVSIQTAMENADGIMFDHVAFSVTAIPEDSAVAHLGVILLFVSFRRLRKRDSP